MPLPEGIDAFRSDVRQFVDAKLMPHVLKLDLEQAIPAEMIAELADAGCLAASIGRKFNGLGLSPHHLMVLHMELARAHGSIENLVTVTGMVAAAMSRFSQTSLLKGYLADLAAGRKIASFAVTEPNVGSSLSNVETTIREDDDVVVVDGTKKWITLAQIADFFVVLGSTVDGGTAAVVVDRATPGLTVTPVVDMLGLRANMLGTVKFCQCRVPRDRLLGHALRGVATPITFGLDEGRFTTACGAMGIAEASLEQISRYCVSREQAGKQLYRHQLVQKILTETLVAVLGARELVGRAADARAEASPDMIQATMIAKYTAVRAARMASDNAVQLLGAGGCQAGNHVERYFRDAKACEIIEGTTQIHEIQIALGHIAACGGRGAS